MSGYAGVHLMVDPDTVVAVPEGKKRCRQCGNVYALTFYYNLERSPDGKHPECIQCCKVNRALDQVRKRDKRNKISVRQRVRAINLGIKYDADITLAVVFKRDRGICYLCRTWVTPGQASMDHKLALTNGGTHTWDNVRLTHLTCNLRKGKKFLV